jgi:hypothetical protein
VQPEKQCDLFLANDKIRGGGPVWDVESGGTVGVLIADCQRTQSRARLKPETMIVTFEEFSPTHNLF